MNREQKEAVVADVRQSIESSAATFLVNYKGASVPVLQSLRRALYAKESRLKVTKARLMKIAAEGIEGSESLNDYFKDQIGLVFAKDQVSEVAKELVGFSKQHGALQVVSGFYESSVLTKEQVEFFASLPPREVLLGQVVGTIQAPIAQFASLLNQLIVRLLYVLQRIAEKKEA